METTRSGIFVFFIVLKRKEIFQGGNLQPCRDGYFHLYVKVLWRYYCKKTTLIIIFNKYKQSEVFREKNRNVLPNNHNFSPAMHGLGISLINKRSSRQEKKYVCNWSILSKQTRYQLFLQISSQVFVK